MTSIMRKRTCPVIRKLIRTRIRSRASPESSEWSAQQTGVPLEVRGSISRKVVSENFHWFNPAFTMY